MIRYDAILIDDDSLVQMTWKYVAKEKGKSLLVCTTAEEFWKAANDIDRNTPVYVDSNLGNDVKGTEVSLQIFEAGFKTVYLETGYPASEFPPMPWLKGILGKDPIWD